MTHATLVRCPGCHQMRSPLADPTDELPEPICGLPMHHCGKPIQKGETQFWGSWIVETWYCEECGEASFQSGICGCYEDD